MAKSNNIQASDAHFKSFLLPDAFAGREGQTPPFERRAHAAPAFAKKQKTLYSLGETPFILIYRTSMWDFVGLPDKLSIF